MDNYSISVEDWAQMHDRPDDITFSYVMYIIYSMLQ